MPEHDGSAHGETDGNNVLVAKLAGIRHRRVDVVDLLVAERAKAAGPAMPAEVECRPPAEPVQLLGYSPQVAALPAQRESMRQYQAQAAVAGQVNRLDRNAIVGYQGHCRGHGLGHGSILLDGPGCLVDASSLRGVRCGSLVPAKSPAANPEAFVSVLEALVSALRSAEVQIVDLTARLEESTPLIQLPEPFANTIPFRLQEISRYDDRGPAWYWNNISTGEHTGTHFDAPVHWVTGRDREDVAAIPLTSLVAPAVVLDFSEQAAADPDFLLEPEHIREWEAQHGELPA